MLFLLFDFLFDFGLFLFLCLDITVRPFNILAQSRWNNIENDCLYVARSPRVRVCVYLCCTLCSCESELCLIPFDVVLNLFFLTFSQEAKFAKIKNKIKSMKFFFIVFSDRIQFFFCSYCSAVSLFVYFPLPCLLSILFYLAESTVKCYILNTNYEVKECLEFCNIYKLN